MHIFDTPEAVKLLNFSKFTSEGAYVTLRCMQYHPLYWTKHFQRSSPKSYQSIDSQLFWRTATHTHISGNKNQTLPTSDYNHYENDELVNMTFIQHCSKYRIYLNNVEWVITKGSGSRKITWCWIPVLLHLEMKYFH